MSDISTALSPGAADPAAAPALFDPIRLREVTIRNRLWVAPMCQYSVETRDGVPTDWHLVHLGSMAAGGAGLIVTEATAVSAEGRITDRDTGLWNDEQTAAWTRIVDHLHRQGATAGIQLAHAGRKASTWPAWGTDLRGSVPADQGGWPALAPSAVAFPGYAEPVALERAGIDAVIAGA